MTTFKLKEKQNSSEIEIRVEYYMRVKNILKINSKSHANYSAEIEDTNIVFDTFEGHKRAMCCFSLDFHSFTHV